MDKIFIELYETTNKKGFTGNKNGNYYYVFPAGDEAMNSKGIVSRCLVYNNEEDFNKKLAGERIDAKQLASIKEFHNDKGFRYGGMLFDNDNKKAFFINIYDNDMRNPEKKYDKLLILKETEWREKQNTKTEGQPF